MNGINKEVKETKQMTKERKEILEKVVEKAFKENRAVFERLDEI